VRTCVSCQQQSRNCAGSQVSSPQQAHTHMYAHAPEPARIWAHAASLCCWPCPSHYARSARRTCDQTTAIPGGRRVSQKDVSTRARLGDAHAEAFECAIVRFDEHLHERRELRGTIPGKHAWLQTQAINTAKRTSTTNTTTKTRTTRHCSAAAHSRRRDQRNARRDSQRTESVSVSLRIVRMRSTHHISMRHRHNHHTFLMCDSHCDVATSLSRADWPFS
jgi:hypothetical protein